MFAKYASILALSMLLLVTACDDAAPTIDSQITFSGPSYAGTNGLVINGDGFDNLELDCICTITNKTLAPDAPSAFMIGLESSTEDVRAGLNFGCSNSEGPLKAGLIEWSHVDHGEDLICRDEQYPSLGCYSSMLINNEMYYFIDGWTKLLEVGDEIRGEFYGRLWKQSDMEVEIMVSGKFDVSTQTQD